MDITRRDLFQIGGKLLVLASAGATLEQIVGAEAPSDAYKMADHWWGMIVDIDKCIGCGNCVRGCSRENGVPKGYYRTWVERYQVEERKQPVVDSPDGAMNGFPPLTRGDLKALKIPATSPPPAINSSQPGVMRRPFSRGSENIQHSTSNIQHPVMPSPRPLDVGCSLLDVRCSLQHHSHEFPANLWCELPLTKSLQWPG